MRRGRARSLPRPLLLLHQSQRSSGPTRPVSRPAAAPLRGGHLSRRDSLPLFPIWRSSSSWWAIRDSHQFFLCLCLRLCYFFFLFQLPALALALIHHTGRQRKWIVALSFSFLRPVPFPLPL